MADVARYQGPQCPRCSETLLADWIQSGTMNCPMCGGTFEAMAFHPPAPVIHAAEQTGLGPEGGTACANHARNEAVTSCQRCGLIICALCDMNIGTGSYCPACFDRVRAEGGLPTAARRYRDFTAMGRLSLIAGFFLWFMMVIFGALAVYFSIRGMKQRRELGRPIVGPIVVLLFGLLEVFGSISLFALLVYSLTRNV
jgi:uncharacterized paraquat-inducible protein A